MEGRVDAPSAGPPHAARRARTHLRGRFGQVVIDHPPVNVLDVATIEDVRAALERLEGAVDVLVIRGEGSGFSAGADVAEHAPEHARAMLAAVESLATEILDFPAVTIAGVHGACLGAGAELVLCCDFAVAAEGSVIGFPEIDVGCFPPIAAALLPAIAGRKGVEAILLGTRMTAKEARDLGIVGEVAPPRGMPERVEALSARLLEKSGAALRSAVLAMRATPEALAQKTEAFQRMRRLYVAEVLPTEDAREGVDAFLAKRPPRWRHR
jgi:cyclohexa-1,5-dienecarbonyl-CoA hydratase